MIDIRAVIAGLGLVTPLGNGVEQNWAALLRGSTGNGNLTLFPTPDDISFPVGEVAVQLFHEGLPRTHQLAVIAAKEALGGINIAPDAVVIGTTTGGMSRTEDLLKKKVSDPSLFSRHGAGSVAEYLASELRCRGPAITISTACSSGAAAMALAVALLKTGQFQRILAGGAESLCRLTYHGFNSLQLIDPKGARPLDRDRKGLTVSEGAGMMLLMAETGIPDPETIEILGTGLTCDAHHPASPDPEGNGAFKAMKGALEDADITASKIDYVNLHGTGTIDNDLAEAKAFHRLFHGKTPPCSSIKGAVGHSLSASGAVEAVVSANCVKKGAAPPNTGYLTPDPRLNLRPLEEALEAPIKTVLSNAFGFGGGNASLVIGKNPKGRGDGLRPPATFHVVGLACITGAGDLSQTLKTFMQGRSCQGRLSNEEISKPLSSRSVRRLKRLSRLGLNLAEGAFKHAGIENRPDSVFLGTGWGALSETHDFLKQLYETEERFSSPTDFIGSVHNATAGRIAIKFNARGPNITTTGGDHSFEQALLSAQLLAEDDEAPLLVMGADEFHPELSPLFDPSVRETETPSDGGGALLMRRSESGSGTKVGVVFYESANENPLVMEALVNALGGTEKIAADFGAILAGLPAASRMEGKKQLDSFLKMAGFSGPVIDYRKYVGEFASASAVAAVLGSALLKTSVIPDTLAKDNDVPLNGKGILLLGLGNCVTAVSLHDGKVKT